MSELLASERPRWELADVIRQHGEAFLDRYGGVLTETQRKTLSALAACRTAALGGHVEHCLDCGHNRIAYNSCRNRHCPKCQALLRAHWWEREAGYLLPVDYHHVVFTLPQEVAALALVNPARLYRLLFQATQHTLRVVAANPKRLGAKLGVLAVLHTWGQNLHHHPHLHCVVTGGGLACDEQGNVSEPARWISCRPGFFLPVRVLSRVFRGRFLAGLRELFDENQLCFTGLLAALADRSAFERWLLPLQQKEWVVYSKAPFGGPEQVLKYLARYTHRVALSNSRLVEVTEEEVTFRYKDYAHGNEQKTMTLSGTEFLRRFVPHILPRGFVKIRHYGLLANRHREANLHRCRQLLLVQTVSNQLPPQTSAKASEVSPADCPKCPKCGGSRLQRHPLVPEPAAEGDGSNVDPSSSGADDCLSPPNSS